MSIRRAHCFCFLQIGSSRLSHLQTTQSNLNLNHAAPPAVEPPEEERGSELVQTALILALVVIVAIGVLQALGVNIVGKFQDVVSALGGG